MTHQTLPMEALDYHLPPELIATSPADPRDSARMLVVSRTSELVEHRQVRDLPDYLQPGDLMVFNDTAVTPARFKGTRVDSGGAVEGLFLSEPAPGRWLVMLKSNGRLRPGLRVQLSDDQSVEIELVEKQQERWLVTAPGDAHHVLAQIGATPLPPYILRARQTRGLTIDDTDDRAWYQTVYADVDRAESVAAPTAGLHFTADLLARLDARGIDRHHVTLHVGPGTFKPVTVPTLSEHPMHAERFMIQPSTRARLREHQRAPTGRLLAVGTTTVRTLEAVAGLLDVAPADQLLTGETDLLIAPRHRFALVDGMLTNFHLPRSTLLALVAAMIGLDRVLELYRLAVGEGYRFYSYGDAMLILP